MSLILSGSDGVSDIDGSASTPAIRGTDTNTGIFFGTDIIGFSEGGAEVARFNADAQFVAAAGTASLPVITTTGDVNTGIFFPAADTIAFAEGGAEAMRIDSDGDVGIGTNAPSTRLHVKSSGNVETKIATDSNAYSYLTLNAWALDRAQLRAEAVNPGAGSGTGSGVLSFWTANNPTLTERARIDSSGNFLVGKTALNNDVAGVQIHGNGIGAFTRSANIPLYVNRLTDDGTLVEFSQAGIAEGTISVSGNTVSYNGGNLSRWAQLTTPKDDTPLFKGTVMSNLDEMNVYIAPTTYWTEEDELPEGVNVGDVKVETHQVDNEQLNKVKVSDVECDVNVAGVFVNWTYDEAHQVDEINMAMTGDMIIRIAQGVVVQKGDLLMSAGDGTAKPQGDDIVRSKTVAKVTSNHVTCTYADGSYCVPCVLMAC